MKQTKICSYCGKVFLTNKNAKKFCKELCANLAAKRYSRKHKPFICQWCSEAFYSPRRKKFCSSLCQRNYMKRVARYKTTMVKFPVKYTIEDIATKSREEGLTYGRYVSIKKIK